MKKYLVMISICFAAVIAGFTQTQDLSLESLLDSRTSAFIDTKSIADLVVSHNSFDVIMDPENKALQNDLKTATGVDIFDAVSLQNAGVDIKRRAGLALSILSRDDLHGAVIIPTSDEKKLSQFLAAAIPVLLDEDDSEKFTPVSTAYKNFKIEQIAEEFYITSINGYLAVCTSAEFAKSIIDRGLGAKSLSGDSVYLDYVKQRNKSAHTVSLFIRGSVLTYNLNEPNDILGSIKYIIVAGSEKKEAVTLQLGVSFDNKSDSVKRLLACVKPGMTGTVLDDDNVSVIYTFLSLDMNALDEFCQREGAISDSYMNYINQMSEEYGIDVRADVFPYAGVINGMTGDLVKKEMLAFCPIIDASKSLALGKKAQAYMKKKYEPQGLFGYEKVGSYGQAAYRFNASGVKEYVYSDQRGLYISNSITLLNDAAKKATLGKSKSKMASQFSNDVWGFLRIKRNELISAAATHFGGSQANDLIDRIGDMRFYFKKSDSFILVDADIAISAPKK